MKITLKADFQKDDHMNKFLYLPSIKPIKIGGWAEGGNRKFNQIQQWNGHNPTNWH